MPLALTDKLVQFFCINSDDVDDPQMTIPSVAVDTGY